MPIDPRKMHSKSNRSNRIIYGASCFAAGASCALIIMSAQTSGRKDTTGLDFEADAPQQRMKAVSPYTELHSHMSTEPTTTEATTKAGVQQNLSHNTEKRKRTAFAPGFCRTSSTGYEILLESFMGNIFEEAGFLPEGSVLDVGAQFGENACHFASLSPDRTVHALDPSPSQCRQIAKFAMMLPNLQVTNAGIGKTVGEGIAGEGFTGMNPGDTFRVETIDNIFFGKGEKLAFAHIDVEGRELDVLKGGIHTIAQDQPVFTAELRVHQDPEFSKELLDYINQIGYDAYVVDEPCGWPHMDYRNVVNFPRSRMQNLEFSDAFNFAVATEAIFPVNSKTIFEKVYPCCALGGECCPYKSTSNKGCCHERHMLKWHKEKNVKKPMAMQGFTYSRRHVMQLWGALRKRSGMTPEQAIE